MDHQKHYFLTDVFWNTYLFYRTEISAKSTTLHHAHLHAHFTKSAVLGCQSALGYFSCFSWEHERTYSEANRVDRRHDAPPARMISISCVCQDQLCCFEIVSV
jgi:hypothetical protein